MSKFREDDIVLVHPYKDGTKNPEEYTMGTYDFSDYTYTSARHFIKGETRPYKSIEIVNKENIVDIFNSIINLIKREYKL